MYKASLHMGSTDYYDSICYMGSDFDAAPTPEFRPSWRPLDPLGAVLSFFFFFFLRALYLDEYLF